MKGLNVKGFLELKSLGSGTYGAVYKARRDVDGKRYAVKVVNLSPLSHREIEDSVNEIRIMASFTSPFIVRFYEALCDNKRLCIVTEYCRLGDLAHLIERKKKKQKHFKEDVIWCYLLQLLEGLRVLHSWGIVHRDLKAANILIADLGVSTVLRTSELARTQIGTPLYLAPEVWKKRPYDQKCDMWALGVLVYQMMTFTFPFIARSNSELAHRVCLGRYSLPEEEYSGELLSIVRRLLQVSPSQRPTVDELMNLQCIRSRMHFLNVITDGDDGLQGDQLLSTIRVPANMKNVNLPNPAYGKKPDIVKPIDQRMHMKKGVPMHRDLPLFSSPELQMVADLDWWSPNRPAEDAPPAAPARQPDDFLCPTFGGAPGRVLPPAGNAFLQNPRFRRPAIR
jgi:NIMA (never in mitosis gene a)-related kinase